jgi:hypothetical protein
MSDRVKTPISGNRPAKQGEIGALNCNHLRPYGRPPLQNIAFTQSDVDGKEIMKKEVILGMNKIKK